MVFLNPVKTNKYIILFIRKPFNTWILSRFSYKKSALKESKIWMDQSHYKIKFYSETSSRYVSKFIDYLLIQTNKTDKILDLCCNRGRFLKALHHNGYRNLFGVDIMNDAIIDLQNSSEYRAGDISSEINLLQDYLLSMKDRSVDYAIT